MTNTINEKPKSKSEILIELYIDQYKKDIDSSFSKTFSWMSGKQIKANSTILDNYGVAITLSDNDGNSIIIFFPKDEKKCYVLADSTGDKEIVIDFSSVKGITSMKIGSMYVMNLVDLSWMNKSVVFAILNAGKMDVTHEKYLEESSWIEYVNGDTNKIQNISGQVMVGSRVVSLPIIRYNLTKEEINYINTIKKLLNISINPYK